MIKSVRIQNFRSLRDVHVELEPFTVLIGKSGTGKSNFVKALRLLRDLVASHGAKIVEAGRGANPIGLSDDFLIYEIEFTVKGLNKTFLYSLVLKYHTVNLNSVEAESLSIDKLKLFEHSKGNWITRPAISPLNEKPQGLLLGSLTGLREAKIAFNLLTKGIGCYDFPDTVLTQDAAQPDDKSGFTDQGTNFKQVASGIIDNNNRLGDWEAIGIALSSLSRSARSLDLRMPHGDLLQVGHEANSKIVMIDVKEESEGFRKYLAHLLALYQSNTKQTLVFEHPESGIHPGALESLFEEFENYVSSQRGQILLTTHSPQLLDYFNANQIRVVELNDRSTTIGTLDEGQTYGLKEQLLHPGELLTVDPARIA